MATISLHEYVAQVEALLKQEAYEQAVTLCQHALRSFPKCVDFYRMLGQACLESDRPDDAADMFRRVLGADPQNFVARVGLGVVAEGIGAFDEALWQWDRALELEPHHGVVRDEWRRVRQLRDKQPPPPRAKLNRTALGYVYLRGEQFDRAADEFHAMLGATPKDASGKHDRFDLQIALAEALYRGGRQREASEQCQQVLAVLPNALKPNLMLGDIYHESGRDEEAQSLFQRAQNVDPENNVASRLLSSSTRLPRRTITIEEPEGTGFLPVTAGLPQVGSATAATAVPLLDRPRTEEISTEDNIPEWLKTLRAQSPASTAATSPAGVETQSPQEAPEWLKQLGTPSVEHEPEAEASSVAQPPPADTSPAQAVPVAPEAPDMPDWLRRLRGTVPGSEPDAPAESAPASAPMSQPAAPAEPVPDWLANLRSSVPTEDEEASGKPEAPVAPEANAEDTDAIPAWLSELRQPGAEPPQVEPAPEVTPEAQLSAQAEALPALLTVTEESAPTPQAEDSAAEPAPAWLGETSVESVALVAELAEPAAEMPVVQSAPEPLPAPVQSEPVQPLPASSSALPREAVAFLDDANAPPSVETQVAPTGDNEHRARLELARVMKDIDAESALGLYELMDGASDNLRQQAIADVSLLVSAHPRAKDVLERLRAGGAPAAGASEAAPTVTSVEATEQTDDAAMPPALEHIVAPVGVGQYAARLDLARMLVDLELDSALDQYDQMEGAPPDLLRKAVDDVAILTVGHPESQRAGQVLDHLQRSLPQLAEAVADSAEMVTTQAESRDEELSEQADVPPKAETPPLPVVSEEAVETGSVTLAAETVQVEAPVVDEAISEELPREPARPPMSTAQFRARLDLARALKFIDVEAAFNLYELMVGSNAEIRAEAIGDLEALVGKYPRAAAIIDELKGTTKPSPAAGTQPDWIVEGDSNAPPQGETAALEPVVAEESMEEPLQATGAENAEPLPVVDEAALEEDFAPAEAPGAGEDSTTAIATHVPTAEEAQAGDVMTAALTEEDAGSQTPVEVPSEKAAVTPIVDEQLRDESAEPVGAESVITPLLPIVDEQLAEEPRTAEPSNATTAGAEAATHPAAASAGTEAPETAGLMASVEALAEPIAAEPVNQSQQPEPSHAQEPPAAPVIREGADFLSDAAAPASIESQEAPTGEAEYQARLALARALREIDVHEGAGQYKSLVDDGVLLGEVITDLKNWVQARPNERVVRVVLAEALTKAGRLPEAVEQYRLLV